MSDDQSQRPLISDSSKHYFNQRPPDNRSPERPQKIPRVDEEDDAVEEAGNDGNSEIRMNTNPRVQRYLIAVEYIGTRFSGAQQQAKCRTVVGVLEEAFLKFIGQPVSIFCSSRTDAGVHALSNVCHVDVERISKRKPGETLPPHEPAVVKKAVNHFLQKNEGDVMVTDVRCVPSDFHARYKARERTLHWLPMYRLHIGEKYFYRLLSGPETLSAFEKDRAWHVAEELDLLSMQKACQVLVGRHDFSSFRAAGCQAKSPIRTLDELNVTKAVSSLHFPSIKEREQSNWLVENSSASSLKSESEMSQVSSVSCQGRIDGSNESSKIFGMRKQHRSFVVTARAQSFLYHQVRLLVGVLKCVGTGELTVDDVESILNAKTVTAASPMAPACGLYLGHVKYDLSSEK